MTKNTSGANQTNETAVTLTPIKSKKQATTTTDLRNLTLESKF